MARSKSETENDASAATPPKPTYESGTLPSPDGDVAKRERRACEEAMVVIPAFDSWGYVPENDPVYRTATASGSIYDVDPRSGDDCMDTRMNKPDDGCKHTRRVVRQLNNGALPAPDQSVDSYLREQVPALIEQFADDYRRLTNGQEHPDTDGDNYVDALAEVEHFLEVLSDAYRDYRGRAGEDAPPLAEQVESLPEPGTADEE